MLAEKWKVRLAYGALEVWPTIIVFVIPDGRCVVRHYVHRRYDRVDRILRDPRRDESEWIALEEIAGVEENYPPGIGGANRINDRCRSRQASRALRGIGVIVPAADAAVHVGRRDDYYFSGFHRAHPRRPPQTIAAAQPEATSAIPETKSGLMPFPII